MVSSTRMRALLQEATNGPFREITMGRQEPEQGQVLVRIHASGVNPLDLKIRSGQAAHARHALPAILGLDLAGVIEEVGAGVTQFRPGDRVYGLAGGVGGLQGSLAEFVTVDAQLLATIPDSLSMRDAAALPLVFITAWEGLVDRAAVLVGQTLLVLGTGGVGHMVVQIGKARGAEVFATGSAGRLQDIERLGATAIERESPVEEFVSDHTGGTGFDVVYDTVGGSTLDIAFHAVGTRGHVVSCLGWGSHLLAPLSFRAATYSGVFTLLPLLTGKGRARHGDLMREASRMVEAGQLRPRVDPRSFNFSSAEAAYEHVRSGRAEGKVVIEAGF